MDDAAVMAGLMLGDLRLFLQQQQLDSRTAFDELQRRRQADDAAADDRDIVLRGHGLEGSERMKAN
jgi:hypothetical protein